MEKDISRYNEERFIFINIMVIENVKITCAHLCVRKPISN